MGSTLGEKVSRYKCSRSKKIWGVKGRGKAKLASLIGLKKKEKQQLWSRHTDWTLMNHRCVWGVTQYTRPPFPLAKCNGSRFSEAETDTFDQILSPLLTLPPVFILNRTTVDSLITYLFKCCPRRPVIVTEPTGRMQEHLICWCCRL